MEIKYLKNGVRVSVITRIEQGVLVKNVYEDVYDELYEDELTYLVDQVYDLETPIQSFTDEILVLKDTITQLKKEVKFLRAERQRLQNNIITAKTKKVHVNFS